MTTWFRSDAFTSINQQISLTLHDKLIDNNWIGISAKQLFTLIVITNKRACPMDSTLDIMSLICARHLNMIKSMAVHEAIVYKYCYQIIKKIIILVR